MNKSLLTPVLLIVLFTSILHLNTFAQKTEDVQSANLLVSGVKIDGAISDWAIPLKANNKSTGLAYTIANDQKYLYVAMQSTDKTNNTKILMGGITFTLNPEAKKKEKDAFIMTYPVITRGSRRSGGNGGTRGQGGGSSIQRTQEQRDSMQLAQTKAQLAAAKDIKVFGFKDITDSLISIYNEYGIKVATSIDDKGVFIYELAIPLAVMNLSADKPKEFTYNIKVNGLQMNGFGGGNGGGGQRGGNGGGGGFGGGNGGGGFGGGNRGGGVDFQALTSPTDFWGKYTLAK